MPARVMPAQTLEALEERLTAVETKIERLEKTKKTDKSDEEVPWWKKIVGIHADTPGFEEAVRLGREWRESQNLSDAGSSV